MHDPSQAFMGAGWSTESLRQCQAPSDLRLAGLFSVRNVIQAGGEGVIEAAHVSKPWGQRKPINIPFVGPANGKNMPFKQF
jgi:hypothetical protein